MFYCPIKRDGYPSDFTDLYFKWFLHKIFTNKKLLPSTFTVSIRNYAETVPFHKIFTPEN